MSEIKLELIGDEDGFHTFTISIGKLKLQSENLRWIGDDKRKEVGDALVEALTILDKHYEIITSNVILELLEDEFNLNLQQYKKG